MRTLERPGMGRTQALIRSKTKEGRRKSDTVGQTFGRRKHRKQKQFLLIVELGALLHRFSLYAIGVICYC